MRLSAAQMCSSNNTQDNLAIAAKLIKKAAQAGSQLVVLPEMFSTFGSETEKLNAKEKLGQGPVQDFLSQEAKKNHIWIVGGTIPIVSDEPNRVRAACLLYNDQGEMAARYDKIHLFDVTITENEKHHESKIIQPGNTLVVVNTPIGKLGLAVCYDIRFPELFRCLFNMGAEIIAIPAAFTVVTGKAHWEVLMRARAIENFCYVIGAGQAGTHSTGRQTYGHSLIIHPWGNIIQSLDQECDIITADINLDDLRKIRKSIPISEHQTIYFNHRLNTT